eukprot:2597075-Pyramimonas_sp.AAC.1
MGHPRPTRFEKLATGIGVKSSRYPPQIESKLCSPLWAEMRAVIRSAKCFGALVPWQPGASTPRQARALGSRAK